MQRAYISIRIELLFIEKLLKFKHPKYYSD